MCHFSLWTVIGATLFLSLSTQASAAVVYVNQNAPAGTNNGASWGTAFLTIQAAIDAAHPDDEVWVAKGTYSEGVKVPAALSLYGGFAGTETARGQRDPRANLTVLPGGAGAGYAILCLNTSVLIDGFRIAGAATGVSVQSSAVIISNCVITDCVTGIDLLSSAATLIRNLITGNGRGLGGTVTSLGLYGNTVSANHTGISNNGFTSTTSAVFVGNTVTGNNIGFYLVLPDLTMVNNLVAFNGANGIGNILQGTSRFSHNNVYGNGRNFSGIPDPTGRNGNISVDPRLSSAYRDVHIQPDSPCRDAGDIEVISALLDRDGQPRLQGGTVDIGSDESDGTRHPPLARVWYVAASGNDANAGSSWAAAKKTVGAALGTAQGGDEVWVARGTYAERLVLPAGVSLYGGFAGTEASRAARDISSNTTSIQAPDAGDTVILCPLSGIRVDGLSIVGGKWGVQVAGAAVIAGSTVSSNDTGVIVTQNAAATLQGNTIYGNSGDGVFADLASVGMEQNVVAGNGANGVKAGTFSSLTLSRNTLYGNAVSGIFVDQRASARLVSNVITGNTLAAVWVNAGSTADLVNNTIAISGFGGVGVNVYSSTAHLVNNIIAFHAGYGVRLDGPNASLTMHRNDVFGNSLDYQTVPNEVHATDIHINPLFASYDNRDFHLAGETVMDQGDDSVVQPGDADMDGNPRILGPHVDMGAYEFVPAGFGTMMRAVQALRIASGLSAATGDDLYYMDVVNPETPRLTIADAARLARRATGLEPNP